MYVLYVVQEVKRGWRVGTGCRGRAEVRCGVAYIDVACRWIDVVECGRVYGFLWGLEGAGLSGWVWACVGWSVCTIRRIHVHGCRAAIRLCGRAAQTARLTARRDVD